MNLYLQNIVEYFNQNNLPADWLWIDSSKFSKAKSLFGYQPQRAQNTQMDTEKSMAIQGYLIQPIRKTENLVTMVLQ